MFRSVLLRFGAPTAMVLATAAFADEPVAKPRPAEGDRAEAKTSHVGVISPQENDRRILRWIAVDHRALLEFSDLAGEHAARDDVKNFAGRMASEHRRFEPWFDAANDRKLPRDDGPTRADQSGRPLISRATPPQTPPGKTATVIDDSGRSRDGGMVFRPTDFVAVKEQVCHDLRDEFKGQFESLKGAEFDEAYLTHMRFSHQALISTIDAVKGTASKELQTRLATMRDVTEKHLGQLKELQKSERSRDQNRSTTRDKARE